MSRRKREWRVEELRQTSKQVSGAWPSILEPKRPQGCLCRGSRVWRHGLGRGGEGEHRLSVPLTGTTRENRGWPGHPRERNDAPPTKQASPPASRWPGPLPPSRRFVGRTRAQQPYASDTIIWNCYSHNCAARYAMRGSAASRIRPHSGQFIVSLWFQR